MTKRFALAAFAGGLLLGGVFVGGSPFVRYSYMRVGSDLQRVDRFTGRVEWAGDQGWWNLEDRQAIVESEIARFSSRAGQIAEAARTGHVASVSLLGRELTVYPIGAASYKVYASDEQDPRLADLLRQLRAYKVPVAG